jgi:anti-sigma regulatory factor (Ser/Thr protein kinase)
MKGRAIDSQAGTSPGALAPPRRIPSGPRGRLNGQSVTRGKTEDAMSLSLDGGLEAAAQARSALSRLRSDLDPPLVETMRLLVTELIANSVKHAQANAVALNVVVGRGAVLVEVRDEGPGFEPMDRTAAQDKASGWGLFLVDRLADRWGVAREQTVTRVWFELER